MGDKVNQQANAGGNVTQAGESINQVITTTSSTNYFFIGIFLMVALAGGIAFAFAVHNQGEQSPQPQENQSFMWSIQNVNV